MQKIHKSLYFLAKLDAAEQPRFNHQFMLHLRCNILIAIKGSSRPFWLGRLNLGETPSWMPSQHGQINSDKNVYVAVPYDRRIHRFTAKVHNVDMGEYNSHQFQSSTAFLRCGNGRFKAILGPTDGDNSEEVFASIYVRLPGEVFRGGWLHQLNDNRPGS